MSGAVPYVELRVGDTPVLTGLEDAESIELIETCDGADVLTLNLEAWDSVNNQLRYVEDRVLFPGNAVELWAGYHSDEGYVAAICKGLFSILQRTPRYTSGGVPLTLTAHDGLQRLMLHTEARVFTGYTRDSDIVRYIAAYHGLATDWSDERGAKAAAKGAEAGLLAARMRSDFTGSAELPATAAVAAPYGQSRRAIQETPEIKGDRTKPRGETDLAFLKRMAESYHYGYPKVRYEGNGREVLIFRPPAQGPDEFSKTFWWRKPDTDQTDLLEYSTEFSVSQAPAGIEILGWDRKRNKPIRIIAKVIASKGKGRKALPGAGKGTAKAALADDDIQVIFDDSVRIDEKIAGTIQSGAQLRLSLLSQSQKAVKLASATLDGKTWHPEQNANEVMTTELIQGRSDLGREDLEKIAREWLRQRLAAWWTCKGKLENQAGLHLLDTDQVHEFRGSMASHDQGHAILTKVVHTWRPGTHDVDFDGQKLIDDPNEQAQQQEVIE